LSGISNKYKVQLSEIRKYNNLPEGEPIFSGQEIFVPGVVIPKAAAAAPTSSSSRPSLGSSQQFISKGGQFIWPTTSPTRFISQGYYSYHRALDLNRLNGWELYS